MYINNIKRILLVLFCSIKPAIALAAPSTPPETASYGPTIIMEPYVVKADHILPQPEAWFYIKIPALSVTRGNGKITIPAYEIISNSHRNDAKFLAKELQLRQIASATLIPAFINNLPQSDIVVIYDDRQTKLKHFSLASKNSFWESDPDYRKVSQAYRQSDKYPNPVNTTQSGKTANSKHEYTVHDTAVHLANNRGPITAYINGSTLLAPQGIFRLDADIQARKLWASINALAVVGEASVIYKTQWVFKGFEYFFNHTVINDIGIVFEIEPKYSNLRNVGQYNDEIFRELSYYFKPKNTTEVVSNEKWWDGQFLGKFVHYGLFYNNGAHQKQFMTFMERLNSEPFSEKMFREIWGRSDKQISKAIRAYAPYGISHQLTKNSGKLPDLSDKIIFHEATQSEIARLKAELLMARSNMEEALDELRIAYRRGEREAEMLASLAFAEEYIGSMNRARTITKALLEIPHPPARAYLVAARLKLADILNNKPDNKLSIEETISVLSLLGKARLTDLPDEDYCNTLADVVINSVGRPDEEIANLLKAAANRFKFNEKIAEAQKLAVRAY